MILSLVFLIVILLVFGTMIFAGWSAAPWLPSFKKDLTLAVSAAGIKPGETVYDLGCGDGRFLFDAAKRTQAGRIIGFEISLLPYLYAKVKTLIFKDKRIKVRYQNFFKADFGQADVIYCFLLPKTMKKLKSKLWREMKPGSRLVSYVFSLPGAEPAGESLIRDKNLPIYVYRF